MNIFARIVKFFEPEPAPDPVKASDGDLPCEYVDEEHVRVDGRVVRAGRVVESMVALQTICPVCEYGEGYCECFIASGYKRRILRCAACGTEFYGAVT